MAYTTHKFRIKDSTSAAALDKMSSSVNFVWNYCNEVNIERWKKFGKSFSGYELNGMTAGCTKDLGLHSHTVQSVCETYAQCRFQKKKIKLKWRSSKKSLGWVPFKCGISLKGDTVTYLGHKFKIWKSIDVSGKIRFGAFVRDARGRWFVDIKVEYIAQDRSKTNKSCGIDLGLKTLLTLSDGVSFTRENLTKKHEKKLAMAQRARKKKQVKKIHSKIKNQRKDWNHKVSTLVTTEYDQIFVGNVSSDGLKKTRMAKGVSDAGWYDLKRMLAYKAIRLGVKYKEVNESYSTVTCSVCYERSGPKGLLGLSVRDWTCSCCGETHQRDVNAAKNILRIGHDTLLRESLLVTA